MFTITETGTTFFSGYVDNGESNDTTKYAITSGNITKAVIGSQQVDFTDLSADTTYAIRVTMEEPVTKYRTIMIAKTDTQPLSLAEVEAFTPTGENVARDGTASQSSTAYNGVASRAINGDTSGLWGQAGVTHTVPTSSKSLHWWKLVFKEDVELSAIKIWNRTDSCCTSRLDGAVFRLYDSDNNLTKSVTLSGTRLHSFDI